MELPPYPILILFISDTDNWSNDFVDFYNFIYREQMSIWCIISIYMSEQNKTWMCVFSIHSLELF